MRVNVEARERTGGGWDVVVAADGGPELGRHAMAAVDGPPGVGPEGVNVPAADQTHASLVGEAGADGRAAITKRILGWGPQADDLELMGRYLFDSLIGPPAWAAIREHARALGERTIELALRWPRSAAALNRLHWELMHDDRAFLAGHPDVLVAVTRVVLDADVKQPARTPTPVRVLFVIGSHLADPQIRSGAEIMGILRKVESGQGAVSARVSEWTTLSSLHRAVVRQRPHVVHLISHGDVVDGKGMVVLRKEGSKPEDSNAEQLVDPSSLLNELRDDDGSLPLLMVITACRSGAGADDHTGPLAAQLVAAGIPAVVGMTGRVSDMACRLFTERFGAVLTSGGRLIEAVSSGRRAALREQGRIADGMSWALPALFLAPAVAHGFAPVDASSAAATRKSLDGFKLYDDPVFCGRQAHLSSFEDLLDPDNALRVLAAYTNQPLPGVGKSRLLHEFARRALRDGHPIVFLREGSGLGPIESPAALAVRLLKELRKTRTKLGLPFPVHSVLYRRLADAAGDAPVLEDLGEADRPSVFSRFLKRCESDVDLDLDLDTLKDALAPDLAALAEDLHAARGATGPSPPAPLLLLEGVEAWNIEPQALFEMLHDLGDEVAVPVAVTCTMGANQSESIRGARAKSLQGYTTRFVELTLFAGDDESLAYQWVLLNPRPGRHPGVSDKVYAPRHPEDWSWVDAYRQFIKLPVDIDSDILYAITLGMSLPGGQLIVGNDQDVLERMLRDQP